MKFLPSPRLAGRIADLSGLQCKHPSVTPVSFTTLQCSLRRTLSSDVTGSRASTRCLSSNSNKNNNQQPPTDTEPSSVSISDQVRLLMRRVPYPVAIITSTDPSEPNTPRGFRGMTVSSFNTVSLRPDPIISFNVRRPSETLTALQSSGRFLVHLLAADQAPACLARDFSRGNHNLSIANGESEFEFVRHTPTPVEEEAGVEIPSTRRSGQQRPLPSSLPLPLLRRKQDLASTKEDSKPAFPFVFECLLHPQNVTVADHTIVVGTVVRALSSDGQVDGSDATTSSSAEDLCLTYANTHFWKMGTEI